ncbi:protein of unknown function [Candidatus Methylomirabilis oxygeniifera]|uniref:Uncharacterized protein n=1 Tax=Methylomirabilis oxygeniifera TaxID=671143 RepID=D5MFW2_METO1|nr:protein of unknown function [Candidatus Methylomirabilis oxyfera]
MFQVGLDNKAAGKAIVV